MTQNLLTLKTSQLSKLTALDLTEMIVEDNENLREAILGISKVTELPDEIDELRFRSLMTQVQAVLAICDTKDIYWAALDPRTR